jgi:hypothetical protein
MLVCPGESNEIMEKPMESSELERERLREGRQANRQGGGRTGRNRGGMAKRMSGVVQDLLGDHEVLLAL